MDDQLYFAQDMMERMMALSTQFIRGRVQNTADCMADQVFCAPTVMEVDMLAIRLAREEIHPDRDCVDDQLYFAQDMMEKMTAPSLLEGGSKTVRLTRCSLPIL